ncbi:hypothetical protein [Vallitalea guaymasensis]|uniref:hypothetical protein n=1 Tax=Vallitalea guaymasensis TaxID=1185412 RepID=UPI000DE1D38C|nr:hypothetical protein [Vallitalea guaymasensis]
MELEKYKKLFMQMIDDFGYKLNLDSLKGIDYFLPIIQEIRKDSSVVIIKFDGEREENIYTVLASGKNLGNEEAIRLDTSDLEGGLAYVCVEYAKIAWGWEETTSI